MERELFDSREKAKRAVMAGMVEVNGQVAKKSSDKIREADTINVKQAEKYVSRGGLKLERALEHFRVDPTGLTAIDLGASTGGFTDCLLQGGAKSVYAIDVGQGQLAWKLRQDDRVVVMEKTNARDLTADNFAEPFDPVPLVVADCSFISLRKILPPAVALMASKSRLIALIKPQFEAGKTEADKGRGVISDPAIHRRVLDDLKAFVTDELDGLKWIGTTESPIKGPAGNIEFLALLEKED